MISIKNSDKFAGSSGIGHGGHSSIAYSGEEIFTAQSNYYAVSENMSNTYRFFFELYEPIDPDALRFAADKCFERYPYLMIRTEVNEKAISLKYNDLPIVVKETHDAVMLNSEETNFHLVALTFYDCSLSLSAFHGLMDGTGVFMFLRTLFYYYIQKRYGEEPSPEGVRLVGDEIFPEEYLDPLRMLSKQSYPKSLYAGHEIKKPFRIDEASGFSKTGFYSYYVRLPEKPLIEFCKGNDSSPASLFSLLLARAVKNQNTAVSKPIVCGLCQNMRPALKAEKAHHSLVGKIYLEYDEALEKLPFDKQYTAFRGRILLESDDDYVLTKLHSLCDFCREAEKLPSTAARIGFIQNAEAGTDNTNSTFIVSYTGRFANESINKHISSIYVDVEAPDCGIILEILTVNGSFFLSFMQEWREDTYFKAFCREIEKIGFDYEVTGEGQPVIPKYKI